MSNQTTFLRNASYLDIIFSGRNKAYGSYELRRNYPRRIVKAASWMLGGALCLSAMFAFRPANETARVANRPTLTPVDMRPLPKDQPKPEQPKQAVKPQPAAPPPAAPTVVFTVPEIAPDILVVNPPPPVDSLEGRTAGLQSTAGNGGNNPAGSGPIGHGDGEDTTGGDGGGELVSNKTFVSVEQMPEFNGDINAYLSRNVHYPESAREAGIEGKSIIRFVVNEDGAISDVEVVRSASASLDAEAARVIRNMPPWKAGRQNGTAVKVYFTIPVRFQLD